MVEIEELINQKCMTKIEFTSEGKVKNPPSNKRGVWFLIGKDMENDKERICLQVASSVDILKEIERNKKYSQGGKKFSKSEVEKKKEFNTGNEKIRPFGTTSQYVYPIGKGRQKVNYLYRQIADKYKGLEFYSVNVDEYLGLTPADGVVGDLIELSKYHFAEAKIACETEARYWNYYPGHLDHQAYKKIMNKKKSDKF